MARVLNMVVLIVMLCASASTWGRGRDSKPVQRHVAHLNSVLGTQKNGTREVSTVVGIDLLAVLFAYPTSCARIEVLPESPPTYDNGRGLDLGGWGGDGLSPKICPAFRGVFVPNLPGEAPVCPSVTWAYMIRSGLLAARSHGYSRDNRVTLVMQNGARIVYDDGKRKNFEQKLTDPDLEDMLAQVYDPGPVRKAVPEDFDPGRFRVDAFFKAVYGADKAEVKAGLTPVDFLGTRVWFTRRNGAAQALERVALSLGQLVKEDPAISDYIVPLGGSFNYRYVRGTRRLSPHSYGIAVDLNPRRGAYWRWGRRPHNLLNLRRRYPSRIVSVFEKHGFIWGGKWYHYDLMHFEYRPELILRARLLKAFSGKPSDN